MITQEEFARAAPLRKAYGLREIQREHWAALHYEKGEFICLEGGPLKHLLFILSGTAKVCVTAASGKTVLFNFYHGEGVLGDVELMMAAGDFIATTSVQAATEVRAIGLPMRMCRVIAEENPIFACALGAELAQKLNHSTRHGARNILYTLEERLCAYIAQVQQDGFFCERLTELAELLGVSYRHLLRTLQRLCANGVLQKEGNGYRVRRNEQFMITNS